MLIKLFVRRNLKFLKNLKFIQHSTHYREIYFSIERVSDVSFANERVIDINQKIWITKARPGRLSNILLLVQWISLKKFWILGICMRIFVSVTQCARKVT
jgi:hypothetical protein